MLDERQRREEEELCAALCLIVAQLEETLCHD